MTMRHWLAGLTALAAAALAGCGATSEAGLESAEVEPPPAQPEAPVDEEAQPAVQPQAPVPPDTNFGPAPEITNDVWLNVDAPIRLAEQRGKVVLVEFWTFGCINCRNVIPSVRGWHQSYSDQGLVVIGVHYPEFDYERDLANIQNALVELDVPYPVTVDNEGITWRAYEQHYWPTLYLIDKKGDIRYVHIGEGAYEETERTIQALLAEDVGQG